MSKQPLSFKKMRSTETPILHQEKAEAFINAGDPPHTTERSQSSDVKKNGKLTTVLLDEEATRILEKLSINEDRSERKITSRLLNAALKAEWEKATT